MFGDEVNAGVQRRETHSCTDRGASRSACQFGYVSDLTTRITTPPRFPIDVSSIGQCENKKAHWRKRDLEGETKEYGSTMAESSVLFLVASGSSLEMNGTLVTLHCSRDCELNRQPRTVLQSSGVSRIADQKRSVTWLERAGWRVTVADRSSANELSDSLCHRPHECKRVELRHQQTWQNNFQMLQRSGRCRRSPCPLNRDIYCEQPNQINACEANSGNAHTATERCSRAHTITAGFSVFSMCVFVERMLMIGIGIDRTRSWKTHQLITLIYQMRTEWSTAG